MADTVEDPICGMESARGRGFQGRARGSHILLPLTETIPASICRGPGQDLPVGGISRR